MKPIEKRIYLTSIWDQQVRARRKLSYIRNYFDMLSLEVVLEIYNCNYDAKKLTGSLMLQTIKLKTLPSFRLLYHLSISFIA